MTDFFIQQLWPKRKNCFLWYWQHWLKNKIKDKFMTSMMKNMFVSKSVFMWHVSFCGIFVFNITITKLQY